jgi:hypothetical protein
LQYLRHFLDFVILICFVIRNSDFVIPVAAEPYRIDYKHEQEQEQEIGDYLCESVSIRG